MSTESTAALATAEDFFGAALRMERVDLGNGKSVFVREMTARERDEYDASLWRLSKKGKPEMALEDVTARTVVMCTVDADGNRIFGDDQVAKLSKSVGAGTLKRIAEVAKRLSGITAEEEEELAKN